MDALVAVFGKLGVETGIHLWKLEDLADEVVRPSWPPRQQSTA
jgi:hypothetical protein